MSDSGSLNHNGNERTAALLSIRALPTPATEFRLADIATKYSLLVPSAFYYEVFDPESEKRSQTITGFSEFYRVDIATVLRHESESASQHGKLTCHL